MTENKDTIVLGIDYGETNIGLAFGRNRLVSPIKTVSGKNTPLAINEILKVVIQNKVGNNGCLCTQKGNQPNCLMEFLDSEIGDAKIDPETDQADDNKFNK